MMESLNRAICDLVIANRVLAHENVVDAYGHISVRHPSNPERYLLSRSLSPKLVQAEDILEFRLDGTPVDDKSPPLYIERFIHAAIYEARPDVMAVVHAHAEEVLPFSITECPFHPVVHGASDMGPTVPVWDIRRKFGDETDLLVRNIQHGQDLARCLGSNQVALMRGHGFVAAGASLRMLVRLCVYIPRNARVLLAGMRLGNVVKLSNGEISARRRFNPDSPEMERGWNYWAAEVGMTS